MFLKLEKIRCSRCKTEFYADLVRLFESKQSKDELLKNPYLSLEELEPYLDEINDYGEYLTFEREFPIIPKYCWKCNLSDLCCYVFKQITLYDCTFCNKKSEFEVCRECYEKHAEVFIRCAECNTTTPPLPAKYLNKKINIMHKTYKIREYEKHKTFMFYCNGSLIKQCFYCGNDKTYSFSMLRLEKKE